MVRVPEAADIKLQEKPGEGERRGEERKGGGGEIGCHRFRAKQIASRLHAAFPKLGQDPKLCRGNIKVGPGVTQQ